MQSSSGNAATTNPGAAGSSATALRLPRNDRVVRTLLGSAGKMSESPYLGPNTSGAVGPEYAVLLPAALLVAAASFFGLGTAFDTALIRSTAGSATAGVSGAGRANGGTGVSVGAQSALSSVPNALFKNARAAIRSPGRAVAGARRLVGDAVVRVGSRIGGHAKDVDARGVFLSKRHLERSRAGGIIVHGVEQVFDGDRVHVVRLDVETDGIRFLHEGVLKPDSAGVVITDPKERRVLVFKDRKRLMVGDKGYEFPAGHVDRGEAPMAAAIRESIEETGLEPHNVTLLGTANASGNTTTRKFHMFAARGSSKVADPVDAFEAQGLAWISFDEMKLAIREGRFKEGASLLAALLAENAGLFD